MVEGEHGNVATLPADLNVNYTHIILQQCNHSFTLVEITASV